MSVQGVQQRAVQVHPQPSRAKFMLYLAMAVFCAATSSGPQPMDNDPPEHM